MKLQTLLKNAVFITTLCISLLSLTYAQQKQSSDPVKKLQQRYNSYGPKQEISFEEFKKKNNQSLSIQQAAFYTGCGKLQQPCDNGDFESGLDTTKWQGAYGTWGSGEPDPSTLTEGFIAGDLFDFNAHQTVVGMGSDPNVGISTTNSLNVASTQALRLGNAVNSFGTELLSKKIQVVSGQTIIKFSYAVVFEDPQHAPEDQPAFSVRVFDCATGQELTGVCNLGNGSNKAVSDRNNPFFQCSSLFGCNVIYRDWSTAQIDLSAYVGKSVNIQFLNKDCGLGGHYGYTYLDDIGTSNCVTVVDTSFYIVRNIKQTDSCGQGQICVDYILPKTQSLTGEVNIDLNIYQNGSLVKTLNSDTLRKDSSTYCFSINPKTLGVDTTLSGFDFTLTGNFSITGTSLAPQTLGNPPDGQVLGQNNDYYITTCPVIGGVAPFFDYPPTPANGVTINAHPGENVTFTVKAEDSDAGDNVTLSATGLPGGATTMPLLPASGNPASTKFMWTPGAGDVGTYPIQFTATDNTGKTTTTTVIVQVTSVTCDTSFRPFVYAYPAYTVANQQYHTIYKGYGPQNIVLTAVPRGGSGNPLKYRFKWDNGSPLPIRVVSPDVTTRYEVDITDGKGCIAHASIVIRVVDVRCGTNNDKVQLCFGRQTLCVDKTAVEGFIKGGAKLGSCTTPAAIVASSFGTTGMSAVKAQPSGSFTAYPNPAKNNISFRWDVQAAGKAKINIMDLQGRIVITKPVANSAQNIDISRLTGGVYMAQLVIDGRQIAIARFTVSK